MGRVVVVTFDENEEEKLNELLHFLSAKKYSEMPDKQNRVLDYGALKINAEYRSVESNGELVQLTNYEFEILYLLAKNPGRIFSKEQIYTQVWKEPYYGAEDNVMGIIRRIRKKIEPDSAKPRYILNVWGMGYKFEVDDDGNPYYICPTMTARVGLFGGIDVNGVIICDPIDGECKYLSLIHI